MANNPLYSTYSVPKPNSRFYIYTNEYLSTTKDTDFTDETDNVAIIFDGLMFFSFSNEVNVPWQPIEGSSFSSDSVQDTPAMIRLQGVRSPKVTNIRLTKEDLLAEKAVCDDQMDEYLENTMLLTIIKAYPIFKTYSNYKLIKYEFALTSDCTALKADLILQEIRVNRGATPNNSNVANPEVEPNDDFGIIDIQDDVDIPELIP